MPALHEAYQKDKGGMGRRRTHNDSVEEKVIEARRPLTQSLAKSEF
jgi:hypothetical protein